MTETLENGKPEVSSATPEELAYKRIDEYRREVLDDAEPLVGAMGYLMAELMHAVVGCRPGVDELLAQDNTPGRRQVADRQRNLNTFLQFHRQIERYGRVLDDLKKNGDDREPRGRQSGS